MAVKKSTKRKGHKSKNGNPLSLIKSSDIVNVACFVGFGIAIILISFLGRGSEPRNLILKEYAKERIVAEFPFSYESEISRQEKSELIQTKTPPIFNKLDNPQDDLLELIDQLNNLHASYEINHPKNNETSTSSLGNFIKENIELNNNYSPIDINKIAYLYNETSPKERSKLFNKCNKILNELYAVGIYDKKTASLLKTKHVILGFSNISKEVKDKLSPLDFDDALVALKISIDSEAKDNEQSKSLFSLYQYGLKPNLVFSENETKTAISDAIKAIEPTLIQFQQGDTLITPGQLITPMEIEKIKAYETLEDKRITNTLIFNELFLSRSFITGLLLFILYLFIRYGLKDNVKKRLILSASATSIILHLLITRLVIESGELLLNNNESLLAILPNCIPIALAPILVAVLIGALPGILSALIVSILFCLGFDNSIDQLLITFLPGIVGVYAAFKTRSRSKLLRACLLSGLTSALGYTILSIIAGNSIGFISQQIICSISIGFLTGVIVVGLLPAFEQIFKITTNITLLELTDFNHPILRRMQIDAPGTYHHSLMVANLSENAAAAIGSDPLLCRVCCLFHDIGKLVKPEYFSENQRGINPHDEKNPSMSALVIKAHVKEGVEMAKQEKLPKVIIDVIKQHHGNSLIKYFYHLAQKQRNLELITPENSSNKDDPKDNEILNETTYRYDGPKPCFKESAIIFFADAVEAASRSLKKISQPAIEEMIDNIFESRIEDGQLDECPLTFKELNQIKNSFTRTLLNMLHSRIEYPPS